MKREELLQLYREEKDPNVKDRLMLNIKVRFEDVSITKAARSLGKVTSWGSKWFSRFAKVEKAHPGAERERLSKRPRKRAIGAGRRFALDLRNRVLLLLFYYRTYATQDVAAEIFGVGQATVSRSIEQVAPLVRQCVPIPARIHDRAKRTSTLEELEEILPRLRCLVDASEQPIQRPKRKDMEKSHYSGKAGRHTAKVQYAVNTNPFSTLASN